MLWWLGIVLKPSHSQRVYLIFILSRIHKMNGWKKTSIASGLPLNYILKKLDVFSNTAFKFPLKNAWRVK